MEGSAEMGDRGWEIGIRVEGCEEEKTREKEKKKKLTYRRILQPIPSHIQSHHFRTRAYL